MAGRSPDVSFGCYLRQAFQSQTHTDKILDPIQQESLGNRHWYVIGTEEQQLRKISY